MIDTSDGGLQGAATGNDWMCHERSLLYLFALSSLAGAKRPVVQWDFVQIRT